MNGKPIITDATEIHMTEILRLNEEFVQFLSPLNKESLARLGSMSEMFKVAEINGKVAAFLIAVREGTEYGSPNYKWFSEKYDRFLYVDRVVVSGDCRKIGLGRLLYDDVFAHAKETGIDLVTAEIDIKPENPVSLKFHKTFGFREVGTQFVAGGKKQVSLQVSEVK